MLSYRILSVNRVFHHGIRSKVNVSAFFTLIFDYDEYMIDTIYSEHSILSLKVLLCTRELASLYCGKKIGLLCIITTEFA